MKKCIYFQFIDTVLVEFLGELKFCGTDSHFCFKLESCNYVSIVAAGILPADSPKADSMNHGV